MVPVITTRTGRAIPLLSPRPEDIDLAGDIAPALSILPRFGGHAGGLPVAQHCAMMAMAAEQETDNRALALGCLLHDAHEAYLGDITTPVQLAIEALQRSFRPDFERVLKDLKQRWDMAIYAAAAPGLGAAFVSLREGFSSHIKAYDIRMLRHERDRFMPVTAPGECDWGEAVETAPPLPRNALFETRWSAAEAEARFMALLEAYTASQAAPAQ